MTQNRIEQQQQQQNQPNEMLYTEEIYLRCSLNVIVEGDVF